MKTLKAFCMTGVVALCAAAWGEQARVRIHWGEVRKITRTEERSIELVKTGAEDFRFTLPKEQIPADACCVDVITPFMTAQKGDDGYWLQARGTYGRFDRDEGTYVKDRQLMPIYGVKKGDSLWAAHVKTWRFDYDFMTTARAGAYETFARFRCDKVRRFFPAYYNDIVIDFHRLTGAEADYNGFAKRYRAYQLDRGAVRTIADRLKDQPELDYLCDAIVVRIQTHASKPIPDKRDGYTQVDFEPGRELPVKVHMPFGVAEEYLQAFKDAGIDKLSICSAGWGNGGYDGRVPGHFPICTEAGGEEAYRSLIAKAKELGYQFSVHCANTDGYTCSPMWQDGKFACRTADGKLDVGGLWGGGRCYWICQQCAWESWTRTEMDKLAALGIRGPHYIDVYSATYPARCGSPAHPCTPEQMAEYQNRILAYARKTLGGAGSESGYDHVIGNIDYINYVERDLKTEHEGKFAGTLVAGVYPVWELVYHGIVLYTSDRLTQNHTRGKCMFKIERSGDPRWMIGDGVEDPYTALKIVEFGGRPIFYTYKFADVPRVKKAWEEFVPVRHLQRMEMTRHETLAPGVFLTVFGEGSKIVSNYNEKPYVWQGHAVNPVSYILVRPEGSVYVPEPFVKPVQTEARVRTGAGGPHIEIDGKAVPPRMFWGRAGTAPRRLEQGVWTRFTLAFTPAADIARGNLHIRFDKRRGEASLRNFALTANGTPVESGLADAFTGSNAFDRVWRIWPIKHDYVHTFQDGVCTVELHPWRLTQNDPDYHFYTKFWSFKKGVRYAFSFEAKVEKGSETITPACYAVGPDGRHDGIALEDAEFNTLYATAAKARAAGVDIVSYGIPEVWKEDGYDFTAFDALTDGLIAVNPNVKLIPRVNVNSPTWWCKRHPDHRMAYSPKQKITGKWSGDMIRPNVATVSSRLYRQAANDYIAAFCRHMMARYPKNFAGIHPTGQNTHEWFYYDSWQKLNGWDPETRDAFRAYLGDPKAEVPAYEERCANAEKLLLDPATQSRVIAFNRFQQLEMTDFVAELARTCRRETEGRKLVVIFYGYAWEFSAHRYGPANSGHYGLENLLAKADGAIDILCSPISYSDRFKCGSAPNMSAGETVMRAGVLWLNEDDTRTHLTVNAKERSMEGDRVTEAESCHVALRNTAQEAVRGFGSWWMDLPGWGWYDSKTLWDVQKALMPVERMMLARRRPFTPEMALIQDEASMVELAHDAGPVTSGLVSQPRASLNRIGAPHGQYLLFDVLRRPLAAKLQFFQSAWVLTDAQVEALVKQREMVPALRVWCYAPGWRNEKGESDLARMEKLTGFAFVPHVEKAGKRAGAFTVVERPGDQVLLRYADGKPSVIVRKNACGGQDAFVGQTGVLTPPRLRKLAELAGVRFYLPADDVGKATLWAADGVGPDGCGHVLSLQAQQDGPVHVLADKGPVRDALTGETVGEGPVVTLEMKAGTTRVLTWLVDSTNRL